MEASEELNSTQLELLKLEYPALRAEELSRENARLQLWGILFSLVGAFGFAGLQASQVAYVTALFPLLAACLARYTAHGEDVLRQVRKYLRKIEKAHQYRGYEHFSNDYVRSSHGSYKKGLRDAIVLFDLFAIALVIVRLAADGLLLASVPIAIIEVVAIVITCVWLH